MTTGCAIIGSGNIGTDLMIKIMRHGKGIHMDALIGIDAKSDGLARAARMGVTTSHLGLDGLRDLPNYDKVAIVFDATSAGAHKRHNDQLSRDGKTVIDLTPAAIGPFVVPAVNMDDLGNRQNLNMVTCGGQATIPVVAAVSRVTSVVYAEIVASIASRSAGPGTRANIDEFTETTSKALVTVGGAQSSKAIIILNPAEPPLIMRDTIYCVTPRGARDAIVESIQTMVARVQSYVPGYRLKQAVQFDDLTPPHGFAQDGDLQRVTVMLEVEGAGHYLPAYAGNLDIMTSAAMNVAEHIAGLAE
jgi:acetaldehyde dehydrogenase